MQLCTLFAHLHFTYAPMQHIHVTYTSIHITYTPIHITPILTGVHMLRFAVKNGNNLK